MEFDIEAAIKLAADIGLRPAVRHYGLNHATLASRIKTHKAKHLSGLPEAARPQTAPLETAPPHAERPEAEAAKTERPESYGWSLIRRHEDETRKLSGKPPLTNEEWAIEKHKMEECNKAMEHFWRPQQ